MAESKTYSFLEVVEKIGLSNEAICVSHTFQSNGKNVSSIVQKDSLGVIWKETNELVDLDWWILQSKWELKYKVNCHHCNFIFNDWETRKIEQNEYELCPLCGISKSCGQYEAIG